MINGRVLITGITGTLGRIVSDMMLVRQYEVIGYSRDEQKQRLMPQQDGMTLYLGDVRDRDRLVEASRGVDVIFHFAALKCVDSLEQNPEEAVATNVKGTENVLHAQRHNRIPRVVLTSTDKAVYPVNAYGSSKALAEKLTLRNPNNVVCRYGNVLGSRGSVLPMFIESLREKQKVYITSMKMTRFWMTAQQAASFVISGGLSEEGGLKIPPIGSCPIVNVADAVAELMGIDGHTVEEIGVRPGEKLHECLTTEYENGRDIFSNSSEMADDTVKMLVHHALQGMKL